MKNKVTIPIGCVFIILILIFLALGFSFWLGGKYENYRITNLINPRFQMKKINEMRNLDDHRNQMANPASMYCVKKKGKLEIRTAEDGNQIGYCKFEDGSECEEWAFFRGECSK